MKKACIRFLALGLFIVTFAATSFAQAPVCHDLVAGNLTYSQNFDTLSSTTVSTVLPVGFGFAESGTNANTTYGVSNGSTATADTYSYGTAGSTDRAFGGLQSSSLVPTVGGCFRNMTGTTIQTVQVTYDGEQWRLGSTGRGADKIDFQYSTDATSLTSGTWTDLDALDFTAPNTTVGGILDGNAAANRIAGITSMISGLGLADGATLYIRYSSFDATNSDDGLAVDNFSLTAQTGSTAGEVSIAGRVTDAAGRGISKVTVSISGGNISVPVSVVTSPFGYYRVDGLRAGEAYVVSVSSKRYIFTSTSRLVSLGDDAVGIDFVAERAR